MKSAFTLFTFIFLLFTSFTSQGQSAFNPNDPDVVFTSSYRPDPPLWNDYRITKWGHTNTLWWGSYAKGFRSYIYRGMAFRVKFPKTYQHNVNDGKKYPMYVFLHGYGEYGTIYDNELQLVNGGLQHVDSVISGNYDGFLLYSQSTFPTVQGYFPYIAAVIDSMVKYVKVDEDRVAVEGLSGGGQACWEFLPDYAKKFAAAVPICGTRSGYINTFASHLTIPIWVSNGGLDNNPDPYTVTNVVNTYRSQGGRILHSFYPNLGHGIWNDFWNAPGYLAFLRDAHKANPLVHLGRTEFCPNEIFNVKLALQAGFYAYEWEYNGAVIPGANTNELMVSTFGTYRGRFKRTVTHNWSDWSPIPVIIGQKQGTVTPPIQVNGLRSSVLPAPDGSTIAPLSVPNTYSSYEWRRVSDNVIVSTTNTYSAPIGQYKVKVTEQFGCSSDFSPIYSVINANGTNVPDRATNLSAIGTSFNTIQLDWDDNPSPVYNETAFEIYRSTTPGTNYQLIAVKDANVLAHLDNNLAANTRYYYIIRAINNNGAAPVSSEANGSTMSDNIAPTAPANLDVTDSTTNSISLSWTASTDNIGVFKYDIFINGAKAYTVSAPSTTFTVYNLTALQPYAFSVKARDLAGNISPASNQVTGVPANNQVIALPAGPVKPADLLVTNNSFNKFVLSWSDRSSDELGFEISRSTQLTGPYTPVATTGPNTTSYIDSVNINASTRYWYKIRSVNVYNQSEYVSIFDGIWGLNNNNNDGSGNNRSLNTATGGSPLFNSSDKVEGSHSLILNGSNQHADIGSTGSFPGNAYNTRTVGIWIKPTASIITATNKLIFDFGGADNGLALRFNSGSLQAGISGTNLRPAVFPTLSNVTSDPNWVSGGWNHVAVVYNVNTLKLFLNGVEKASASLPFTTLGTSTSASRIGSSNGANAFNTSSSLTYYGGLIDDLQIIREPLSSAGILALMNLSYTSDITDALPAIPGAPTNLNGVAQSASVINLNWNDNSSNETSFEIYRSAITQNSFRFLTTVPSGSTSSINFSDTGLFANTNYYYKVRAIGVGGNSVFTPVVYVRTLNNKPVLTDVENISMRYTDSRIINITSSDADGETPTLTILNAPAFSTFTSGANGTAVLEINPVSAANQGSYIISVIAQDGNNGKDTTTFTLIVNSNYTPVLAAVNAVTLNEGTVTSVPLSATDQDGNGSLVFSITSGPSFVTVVNNGNGSGSLSVAPGYAHSGQHTVTVSVNDGAGGLAQRTFTITVNNVEVLSEDIYMTMRYSAPNAPAPWNNINSTSASNLLNSFGQVTPVGIEFLATPWNAGNAGAQTWNNSGVYPDVAIRDYFWFGMWYQPETVDVRLTGLIPTSKYNVTIFGSSAWTGMGDNGTTIYTINGVAKPLYVHNNTQNTVTFTGINPNASGNIVINLSKGANTPYGLITNIVLKKPADDGSIPVAAAYLTATAMTDGTIKLNWTDVAYNELRYDVYRSLNAAGPFSLINPAASNANEISYTDNTVLSNTTYYYKVASVNGNGTSPFTPVVSARSVNKKPTLTAINDLVMKGGTSLGQSISATDDFGSNMSINIIGLPSFATFQNISNGTGNINFAPSTNDLGEYSIIVKVTDNEGAFTTDTFNLSVTDPDMRQVYINYNLSTFEGGIRMPAPWNGWLQFPWANYPITNLKDDNNVNTGFSVRLLQQWDAGWNYGMITGNNSGIFHDNVLKGSIYTTSPDVRSVQIEGLNPAKRYNVVFMSSHNAGREAMVTYTHGAQSVSLDGKYNTNVSAQLNGLTPNASGIITVNMQKQAAAAYLNLNAMVIQEYNTTAPLMRPYNLFATSILETDRIRLTWSDRSSDETGFQIYRSTSLNGTYSLVTTTAANVTSYTNTGLAADTRYFYRIRAVKSAVVSGFSNVATMIVPSRIIFVNLNNSSATNGPSPWNNFNGPSTVGTALDLSNNALHFTGFRMVITKEFNSPGYAGATSGIFPGNVMSSNFWSDGGQTSEVKFTNLDSRKKYRIGCFGSANLFVYAFANYTCNGKTVQLNSYSNNSKVVYLDGLVPDSEGELFLSVKTENGHPYTFTSAFTLEAYEDTSSYNSGTSGFELEPPISGKSGEPIVTEQTNELITSPAETPLVVVSEMKVYPNPFTNNIEVELSNDKNGEVTLIMLDMNGRNVFSTGKVNTVKGRNVIKINTPVTLNPGSYILNVIENGIIIKSVKLIKIN